MQLPPAQRRFVDGIHRSADSLLGIVDDVLDYSKIEAGRLQLALHSFCGRAQTSGSSTMQDYLKIGDVLNLH